MSRGWIEQRERGSPAALALIRWIALHLGRRVGRVLLYPTTLYFVLTSPTTRNASRQFLSRALDGAPTWRDVFRHHFCFAATILDRVFLLAGRFGIFEIAVDGAEILLDRVAAGQGCILLGSHLGSFEVLRAIGVSERRLPIRVLMHRDHNATIARVLDAINPAVARTVIDLGAPGATLMVRDALERGEVVGVLGDRVDGSSRTARVRFLGVEADFPLGPLLLASVLRVPVILFFGLYRGGRRYDVHFELLAESLACDRSKRDLELTQWVQRFARRLEHYARAAPFNWFNFYAFWQASGDAAR
jgi:predicted LPLAT superfamily acyltransferase